MNDVPGRLITRNVLNIPPVSYWLFDRIRNWLKPKPKPIVMIGMIGCGDGRGRYHGCRRGRGRRRGHCRGRCRGRGCRRGRGLARAWENVKLFSGILVLRNDMLKIAKNRILIPPGITVSRFSQ